MKIVNHEFSDTIANINCTNADENNITFKTNGAEWIFFNEEDVRAMVQHFDDIKDR